MSAKKEKEIPITMSGGEEKDKKKAAPAAAAGGGGASAAAASARRAKPGDRAKLQSSKAAAAAARRIHKELKDIMKDPPPNCSAAPKGGNLFSWVATIMGPDGSPYEGGIFKLDIKFTKEYPFKAPTFRFRTRIYHCNISAQGEICLDILKHNWAPSMGVAKVLVSIVSLLTDPNPADPLEAGIASLLKENRAKHDQRAREYTLRHAR